MPKYVFKCESCGKEKTVITSPDNTKMDCGCGSSLIRQMPNLAGKKVNETIDSYNNVKRDQDHSDLMKQRKEENYWTVEVPRLVQKYSVETCLEQGWLVKNEKGELVIGKAPSKR